VKRWWILVGLLAAVAAVYLGFRGRVMLAGGKAIMMLVILAGLVWLAVRRKA
jgi:hypothetical protein